MLHEFMEKINELYQKGLYEAVVRLVEGELREEGHKLLCLTEVGSKLYGTDTDKSDTDLKGIFLPSLESVLLNNTPKSYGMYSTGNDSSANSEEDLDLEVFSLHRFFDLIRKGDTNMYDVLYSKSAEDNIFHYSSKEFDMLYENRDKLVAKRQAFKSFVGYASGQVRRYQNKGHRYRMICKVIDYIKENNLEKNKVKELPLAGVLSDGYISCFEKNGHSYYQVFNSEYPENCQVDKFLESLSKKKDKYGSRVKNTDKIDWKSIHHAFRSVYSLALLLLHGEIIYPLDDKICDFLLEVKQGGDVADLDYYIEGLEYCIDRAKVFVDTTDKVNNKLGTEWMDQFILDCYFRGVSFE